MRKTIRIQPASKSRGRYMDADKQWITISITKDDAELYSRAMKYLVEGCPFEDLEQTEAEVIEQLITDMDQQVERP